jgi:hypothetical protein
LNNPNGTYYRMPADQRLVLENDTRRDLSLSAVQGLIHLDPDAAKAQLNEGRWDHELDADKEAALLAAADTAINGRRIAAEHAAVMADRAERKAREATADRLYMGVANGNPNAANGVLNSNLHWEEKNQLLSLVQKAAADTGDAKTYGPGFLSLFDRIHRDPGDPQRIATDAQLYAYLGRADGVTLAGPTQLRNELVGRRTIEGSVEAELKKKFDQAVRAALSGTNPILGMRDPKGDELVLQATTWWLPEYQRRREAGERPEDLLDPTNPKGLFAGVERYKRPPMQFLRDMMNMNPGNAAAVGALPGAAVKDYKTLEELQADVRAGAISRGEAARIGREKGWVR